VDSVLPELRSPILPDLTIFLLPGMKFWQNPAIRHIIFARISRKSLYIDDFVGKNSNDAIFRVGLHPQNALERFVGIFSRREEKRALRRRGEGE